MRRCVNRVQTEIGLTAVDVLRNLGLIAYMYATAVVLFVFFSRHSGF